MRNFRLCLLCVLLGPAAFAVAADGGDPGSEPGAAFVGRWVLDADTSDDAKDVVKGKLRRSRYPTPVIGEDPRESPGELDPQQRTYWETIRGARERRSMRDLNRLGTVYPLIMADTLAIAPAPGGFRFTYDEILPRDVRPHAAGRVYTARGDELIIDTIGYTLSYWDGDTLVLETDPPDGGKYIERLRVGTAPRELEYRVRIDLTILEEPIEVRRVFVPAAR